MFKKSVHKYHRTVFYCLVFTLESQTKFEQGPLKVIWSNQRRANSVHVAEGIIQSTFEHLQELGFHNPLHLFKSISVSFKGSCWLKYCSIPTAESDVALLCYKQCPGLQLRLSLNKRSSPLCVRARWWTLFPQQTFQCSQWISSGEHLAVNSSKTDTFWLLMVKGKNTMCDVACGKKKHYTMN